MMAGNPSSNWWSLLHPPLPLHHHHQQQEFSSSLLSSSSSSSTSTPTFLVNSHHDHQYAVGSSSSPSPSSCCSSNSSSSSLLAVNYSNLVDSNQELPHHQSWSQLLLGGLSGDGDMRYDETSHFQSRKLENWPVDQNLRNPSSRFPIEIKQEAPQNSNLYGHGDELEFRQAAAGASRPLNWPQIMPLNNSSPRSCLTSLSSSTNNNLLDLTYAEADAKVNRQPDHSFECNSTASGGVAKKARVQSSSSQPPLKVRKEKLGDRITALHQLVSPFGKTDTASVLLEAIGYIRFLQGQIEALSSPYLGNPSAHSRSQQQFDTQDKPKDLRSRGLCLVPLSCTQIVGSDNGADYWAPAPGGGGF